LSMPVHSINENEAENDAFEPTLSFSKAQN